MKEKIYNIIKEIIGNCCTTITCDSNEKLIYPCCEIYKKYKEIDKDFQ